MKTAFAYWENRIAPVFDTARWIHVIETESGRVTGERREPLPEVMPIQKVLRMLEMGVEVLVCGAISTPLRDMALAYGIEVVPFVAGQLRDVILAWRRGRLPGDAFVMPGCRGRGPHRGWQRPDEGKEALQMNRKGQGGTGKGGGQGQGQSGQGRGCRGTTPPPGDAGTCVCPKCGHSEPHSRGVPCTRHKCPKCGASMTRQ